MQYHKKVSYLMAVLRRLLLFSTGLFILTWMFAGTVLSADKHSSHTEKNSKIPSLAMRATELIGRDVENNQGEIIAEIEDVIINEKGCINDVVLSVGELFGIPDKRVAVSFDSLKLKKEWKYRLKYKNDGTTLRVPWNLFSSARTRK